MFGWLGPVPSPRREAVRLVLASAAAATAILALIVFVLGNVGDRNDFLYELWPAYLMLHAGHPLSFLEHSPAYVGAAVFRAPLALVAMALGAGWRLSFLVTAIPCFMALPLFGVWFASRPETEHPHRVVLAFALLGVLDPVAWYAGLLGHPEEMVGITLALAAILLAHDGWPWLACLFIVGAVLDKPGLAELVPVVIVATGGRRVSPALALCLVAALLYALYNLTPLARTLPISHLSVGASTGGDFFPFQLLWWLGRSSWLVVHEHVVIVPVCVLLAAGWWYGHEPGGGPATRQNDVLWLAAFILLFRTALEPWDNIYYNLPLVVCLLCLEADRLPVMTIAASLGALLLVPTNRILALSPDAQAVLYAVIVVPTLLALGARAYRR